MPRALRVMKNRGNSRRNEYFLLQRPVPEIQPPPDHVHSTSSSDSSDIDSDNDSVNSSLSDSSTTDCGSDSEKSMSDIAAENDPVFIENGDVAINGTVSSENCSVV